MEDEEIVALYWERSERALAESQAKYGAYCRAIALRLLGDAGEAEETVNDTLLAAWNAIPPHRPERLSTFLGKLTRRSAVNRWQARGAGKRGGGETALCLDELGECLPAPGGPESELAGRELSAAVSRWLRTLGAEKRRAFGGGIGHQFLTTRNPDGSATVEESWTGPLFFDLDNGGEYSSLCIELTPEQAFQFAELDLGDQVTVRFTGEPATIGTVWNQQLVGIEPVQAK